jgi:hypothetical protein
MSKNKKTPDWDRGGGWKLVKDEWQDWDKGVDKIVTPEELSDMWCPGSGSTITVDMSHVLDGLKLNMYVGMKEYKDLGGGKYSKRKPTTFNANIHMSTGIPMPGCQLQETGGAWYEKKTWSSAVKLMLNEIIPAYENANREAMSLWSVAPIKKH